MNYNVRPRDSFRAEPQTITDHHVLVESKFLRRAIEAALAEYARKQADREATDLGSAAYGFMRIQGAHEFVETLYNLAEVTTISGTKDNLNLPGNVRTLPTPKK